MADEKLEEGSCDWDSFLLNCIFEIGCEEIEGLLIRRKCGHSLPEGINSFIDLSGGKKEEADIDVGGEEVWSNFDTFEEIPYGFGILLGAHVDIAHVEEGEFSVGINLDGFLVVVEGLVEV